MLCNALTLLGVAIPTLSVPETTAPRHVHLAYTASANIVVTWNTRNDTGTSTVMYTRVSEINGIFINTPAQTATGSSTLFVANSSNHGRPQYRAFIHRVVLHGLVAGANYTYTAGDPEGGWSNSGKFHFSEASADSSTPISFLAIADMSANKIDGGFGGIAHELAREISRRPYDVILHGGDIAYDLHTVDNAGNSIGDAFLSDIDAVAGVVPYMVSPGNHESFDNFTHFANRFTMPEPYPKHQTGSSSSVGNMWWSLDLGYVHFISYNTESYFDDNGSNESVLTQYNWLRADLAAAQDNRANVPWIIAMGHRPFYCNVASNTSGVRLCDGEQEQSRVGPPRQHGSLSVEALFHEFGVDLALFGHVHDYSRYKPTYNHTVDSESVSEDGHTYTDPRATTYLTIGGAGNPEMPQPPRSKCSTWDDGCRAINWSPWVVCESGARPNHPLTLLAHYPHLPTHTYTHAPTHSSPHILAHSHTQATGNHPLASLTHPHPPTKSSPPLTHSFVPAPQHHHRYH